MSVTLNAPTAGRAAAFPNLAGSSKHSSPPGSRDGVAALAVPLLPPLWVCTLEETLNCVFGGDSEHDSGGGKRKLTRLGTVTPPSLSNRLHGRPRPACLAHSSTSITPSRLRLQLDEMGPASTASRVIHLHPATGPGAQSRTDYQTFLEGCSAHKCS